MGNAAEAAVFVTAASRCSGEGYIDTRPRTEPQALPRYSSVPMQNAPTMAAQNAFTNSDSVYASAMWNGMWPSGTLIHGIQLYAATRPIPASTAAMVKPSSSDLAALLVFAEPVVAGVGLFVGEGVGFFRTAVFVAGAVDAVGAANSRASAHATGVGRCNGLLSRLARASSTRRGLSAARMSGSIADWSRANRRIASSPNL